MDGAIAQLSPSIVGKANAYRDRHEPFAIKFPDLSGLLARSMHRLPGSRSLWLAFAQRGKHSR